MINRDCFFKLVRIASFMLFALLQHHTVLAEPPQRLILQFDMPLSAEQKQTLTEQIKFIIKSDFSVLPTSTEQRWIIVINPPIDNTNLENANAEIIRLKHVQYAEIDRVMYRLQQE